jgi:RNA polymerase sigma factor (TIGR02999 family)
MEDSKVVGPDDAPNSESRQQLEEMMDANYKKIRRIAGNIMRGERSNHTLQATALVNEAYIRLLVSKKLAIGDEEHFVRLVSKIMHQVLVDHARRPRPKNKDRVGIDEVQLEVTDAEISDDFLAIREALARLIEKDERTGLICKLHFFEGLGVKEIAEKLDLAEITIRRSLSSAKESLRLFLAMHRDSR